MKIVTKKCERCGKTIEGLTEYQVNYNMEIHEKACERKQNKTGGKK